MKSITIAATLALSLTALAVQDGLLLRHVSKVGDVTKYRMKAEISIKGQPATFTALLIEKVTKVAENGDFTVEDTQSEAKVAFGGADMDQTAPPAVVTASSSTGKVLSVSSSASDDNIYRMANLQSLQFAAAPVKVGDTWSIDIKKDDKGAVDAKGNYKVEARERIGDYDTYRIRGTFKESIDKDPASLDATYWINIKDGTLVKLDGIWTNMPLPGLGPTTLKVIETREG